MKKYTWVIVLLLILLPACERDTTPVLAPPSLPPVVSADSILVAQCRLLEDAVEAFAATNDGEYPQNLDTDTLETGESVLDLMTAGGGYVNPYTDEETVPVNGQATGPGSIGYEPVVVEETIFGYTITGFGEETVEVELSNLAAPEDALVLANCRAAVQKLQELVEEILDDPYTSSYTELYPLDENSSDRVTLKGGWLYRTSYLNPFTNDSELILRTAEEPGETGYVSIIRDGRIAEYVVTGRGKDSMIFMESSFDCTMEEAAVISNCRTLEKALERYAWRNGGLYPDDILSERNTEGKKILDYLHNNSGLVNPYTGRRSEPAFNASGLPGQISYEVLEYFGMKMGFRIRGFCEDGQVIELTNIESTEEASVRYNCYMLMEAVEAFAISNGGQYPYDIFADINGAGETVIDMMPRGRAPLNPYTGENDGLVNHTAIYTGQTGYAKIDGRYSSWDPETHQETDSYEDGYVITGRSIWPFEFAISSLQIRPMEALVMSQCRTVQLAVEEFARCNRGFYPGTVTESCPWTGECVVDFLPRRVLLENPTTGYQTEPVDGISATSGQIGFRPVLSIVENFGMMNTGYVITGTAEICGIATFTIYSGEPERDYAIDR